FDHRETFTAAVYFFAAMGATLPEVETNMKAALDQIGCELAVLAYASRRVRPPSIDPDLERRCRQLRAELGPTIEALHSEGPAEEAAVAKLLFTPATKVAGIAADRLGPWPKGAEAQRRLAMVFAGRDGDGRFPYYCSRLPDLPRRELERAEPMDDGAQKILSGGLHTDYEDDTNTQLLDLLEQAGGVAAVDGLAEFALRCAKLNVRQWGDLAGDAVEIIGRHAPERAAAVVGPLLQEAWRNHFPKLVHAIGGGTPLDADAQQRLAECHSLLSQVEFSEALGPKPAAAALRTLIRRLTHEARWPQHIIDYFRANPGVVDEPLLRSIETGELNVLKTRRLVSAGIPVGLGECFEAALAPDFDSEICASKYYWPRYIARVGGYDAVDHHFSARLRALAALPAEARELTPHLRSALDHFAERPPSDPETRDCIRKFVDHPDETVRARVARALAPPSPNDAR
ncbi:MAG: hypothetical protein AAF721_34655, partial [Myxococcota bacterium]